MATRKTAAAAKPATRKAAASKVGIATQAAGVTSVADAMPRSGKLFGADPKRVVGGKAAAAAPRRAGVKTVAQKVAATEKVVAVPRGKRMVAEANPALGKVVPTKPRSAAAKMIADKRAKPVLPKAKAVKFAGVVIPTTRKTGDSDENVPTLQITKVSELSKLIAKLPKGSTVGVSGQELNVYNKGGALIAEIRTIK